MDLSGVLNIFKFTGVRQTQVTITHNGEDVTQTLTPYLDSFRFIDSVAFKADNLEIMLADPHMTLAEKFKKGDNVRATIRQLNTGALGKNTELDCGYFEVDEIELSLPPTKLRLLCTSVPVSGTVKMTKRNKGWEKTTLKDIAAQIATEAKLTPQYEAKENPSYKRVEQNEQSDMAFLSKLCQQQGLSLKVTNQKLVIFDEAEYEKKDPVGVIVYGVTPYVEARLSTVSEDTYGSCTTSYHNPVTGQTTTSDLIDADKVGSGNNLNDRNNTQPPDDDDPNDPESGEPANAP